MQRRSPVETSTVTKTGGNSGREDERTSHHLMVAFRGDRLLGPFARVTLPRGVALELGRGAYHLPDGEATATWRLSIPDARMSSSHARIVNHEDVWWLEDVGSKNGTLVNSLQVTRRSLRDGDLIEAGDTFLIHREVAHEPGGRAPRTGIAEYAAGPPSALTTLSPVLDERLVELALVAPTSRGVLIIGETGTGKELTARAIHDASGRSGPFVAVNCAAIPATLVESAFFGVKRGAYSGATEDRDGWIRAAHGGTLFLDEVAELSEPSQAALLRAIQEREVVPVGGTRPLGVDVRFIAATNQDLRKRIAAGTFREDLYARLAAHIVRLPRLQHRREDMGLLAASTLVTTGRACSGIQRDAVRALFSYTWPRNIRELDNAIASALVLASGNDIGLGDLPDAVRPPRSPRHASIDIADDDLLERTLRDLYRKHAGNISAVARELGRARMQLQRWNKRFGIDPAVFR